MYKDDAKVCNFADALLLAGVDYLVVGPKVLEELNSQYTMGGYNDGTPPPFPPFVQASFGASSRSSRQP